MNDVAAINIDAALVKKSASGANDVVELENGCVCCSNRDELGETLAELASTGRYDHILVETTGVAEPRGLANLFVQKNLFGRSLNDFALLSSLVTVIDVFSFLDEWRKNRKSPEASRARVSGTQRPVFELMLEQIECADILILNKADLVDSSSLEELRVIIHGLNTRAEVVVAERGQVSSEFLLDRPRFDAKETLGAAQWLRALNQTAPPTLPPKRPAGQRARRECFERRLSPPPALTLRSRVLGSFVSREQLRNRQLRLPRPPAFFALEIRTVSRARPSRTAASQRFFLDR